MKLYTFEITHTPNGEFACVVYVQHDCIESYQPETGYEMAGSPVSILYAGRTLNGPQIDLTSVAGVPQGDALLNATAVRLISSTLERPLAVLQERIRDYVAKNPDEDDFGVYFREVQEMIAKKEREIAEESKSSSSTKGSR